MSLDGRKIVVLGGSSGIGLGIARASADAGAAVVIASRSSDKLVSAASKITGDVSTMTVDVANEKSIEMMFSELDSFDHLVVSAGRSTFGTFLELDSGTAREDFEINFWGKYNAAKHSVPKIRDSGSITFISGVYSRKPSADAVVTAASVSATESLGRGLAVALAPIRVNTIAPGLIDTPMIMPDAPDEERSKVFDSFAQTLPSRTIGKPEDIAQVALMVMTNPFINGSTIFVDGGYTII